MCGIAGIVSKSPRKFDFTAFCVLGIANDSRGGDSCGIFIDGKYQYGTNKKKLFQDFFYDNDWLYSIKKSSVAFLHCRKASVGVINETTAQPVVIKENNVVKYVLMHNGTIHNYKELAKKYIPNIDITEMTDSQVMAHIFYFNGYDSLTEYEGGAVFTIADYRKKTPRVLIFKGASKKYAVSKEVTEERPLFYCINSIDKELVFSSIDIQLFALRKFADIWIVPENFLLEFNGEDLIPIKEYDRSNKVQTATVKPTFNHFFYFDNEYPNYCSYLSINYLDNTYSINGKYAHGVQYISKLGRLEESSSPENITVWFYRGIALIDETCFKFLEKLQEKVNLSNSIFSNKFETTIRYLSIDKVFHDKMLWYEATGPESYVPFTGVLKPITSSTQMNICNGVKKSSCYYGLANLDPINMDSKEVLEKCEYLMK